MLNLCTMINKDLIHNHVDELFGLSMHARRVLSLANATHGVIEKDPSLFTPLVLA